MFDEATGRSKDAVVAKGGIAKDAPSEGRFLVDVPVLASAAGTSLCFAWFFGMLVLSQDPCAIGRFRLPFLVSFALAYGIVHVFSERLQRRRGTLAAASLACLSLPLLDPLLAAVGVNRFAGALLCSAAPGFGGALAVALWLEVCCRLAPRKTRAFLSFAMMGAVLLCGLVLAVEQSLRMLFITGFGLLSGGSYLVLRQRFSRARDLADVGAEDSDRRSRITLNSIMLTASNSLAQGFALYGMLDYGPSDELVRGVFCLLAFALLLGLAVDSLKAFILRESLIRYLMLPLIATCLLLMVFMPPSTWIWFCAAVLLVALLPFASAVFATCEHIVLYDLSPLRTVGRVRAASMLGTSVGWCAGWAAFPGGPLDGRAFGVSVAMLVIVLIVITIVFDQKSLYPGSEEDAVEQEGGEEDARRGPWTRRCEAFARQTGLTARETEVMFLLARGFSAELIQERLFISKSTVKCHTYNIYNKAGVHSRTDLIHLIEDVELEKTDDQAKQPF